MAVTAPKPIREVVSHEAPFSGRNPITGTLGKALEVLDLIALANTPVRFTDLLSQTDQPRGTLHRQVSNLIEEGLVTVNDDNSYSAGPRLLKLAARAWSQNSFRSIAEPHVRRLHLDTGETVHLGLLNGLEVVYVDKFESRQTVRMHSQVGNASPLYCTGVGKAMLALLEDSDLNHRVHQMSFEKHTPTTLHTPKLLLSEIEVIRRTGLSHDREEHEPGIYCVAAGINASGHSNQVGSNTIGGISVTSPAYRLDEKTIQNWERLVLQTARAIENDMNTKLGPRNTE